ncbi:uncharacterized protein LOC134368949 [Cynocephalus volans]|uniref:uncharacterized protein LOC134368949 n=1 Tax=Cynocephalus volans TaxID=110931 RepID=UPI002FC9FDC0
MKQLLFKLIGLLFSYMSWVFGITLAKSRSWRVWEFDSKVVHVVFTGLWEAFYFQNFNISGSMVDFPMHSTINETWAISTEIKYGRDLILLANFMKSSVLIFSSTAFWISWIKAPYPDFIQSYYNISAFFLFFSCVCTAGTVTWNFAVDFYGQTTLDFPLSFPVEKESLTKKHFTYVFPLGIITATLSLSDLGASSIGINGEPVRSAVWAPLQTCSISVCISTRSPGDRAHTNACEPLA